jgi:hypothetical protein
MFKPRVFFNLLFASVFALLFSSCSEDEGTTPVQPIDIATCSSLAGVEKLVCIADAFKSQLDASQLAAAQRSYSVAEAKKWSNLPQELVQSANKRVGLAFADMDDTQLSYAKALIKAAAGTGSFEGWDEMQQILNADDYLASNGGGSEYGEGNYYIALLGTPSMTGTWELQFGGHHLAFANTYTDGVLVGATPAFRSSEPFAAFTYNGQNNEPLAQEKNALSAMLKGLSSTELTTARLSSTFSDLLVGPQKDGQFPSTPSGLKVGDLTQTQKDLVLAAIRTYVEDVSDADAVTIMAQYTAELDDTYISYSGTTDLVT